MDNGNYIYEMKPVVNKAMDESYKKGDKFRNKNGNVIEVTDPTRSGEVQYYTNSSKSEVSKSTPSSFANMLRINGYVKVNDEDYEKPLSKMDINELREVAVSLGADRKRLYGTSKESMRIIINKLKKNKANDAKTVDSPIDKAIRVADEYNKYASYTDKQFLKEAIAEMKRYERNWSFMTTSQKRDISPVGGLSELRKNIKQAEERLKELGG